MTRPRAVAHAILAATALAAVAQADEAAPDRVVFDFEGSAALEGVTVTGGAAARQDPAGPDPRGVGPRGAWLRVDAALDPADAAAVGSAALEVVLALPPDVDLARHGALDLVVRAPTPPGLDPPRLRLEARGADGAALFVRPLRAAPRDAWSTVGQPLHLWRWGPRVGAWSEVRALALRVEGAARLELDAVRLGAGARGARSAAPPDGWLAALAFGAEPAADDDGAAPSGPRPWVHDAGGVRVIGDPSIAPDPAALARVGERLRPLAAWLDRIAAGAVRPIDASPVEVLVVADAAALARFLGRLGRAWRVTIRAGHTDGYTVQDVAAVVHLPDRGLDRPVVLHEVVHALAARRLRLAPGERRVDWLQEGLANHAQLALFPRAFDRRAWPRVVAGARPLEEVAGHGATLDDYPGLAALVAYLLAERPAALGPLARALGGGADPAEALAAAGLTAPTLDRAWRAWARQALCAPAPPEAPHWPAPPEWPAPAPGPAPR